jgi:hypothetical protein
VNGKRPRRCRGCDAAADGTVIISRNGLCEDCALDNQIENARQLRERSGPYYDRWLRATHAAMAAKIKRLEQRRAVS